MTEPDRGPAVDTGPTAALLLGFDGLCYAGDLPIQAYGRRIAEALGPDRGLGVIAGMRRFLEDRAVPADPGLDLDDAQDGYQAVDLLARSAGATADLLRSASLQSRLDLAATAFAIEAPDGLAELLEEFRDRLLVIVVSNADRAGMLEVLRSTGLLPRIQHRLAGAGKPECWPAVIGRYAGQVGGPDRLVAVGTRWDRDLAAVAAAGGWTGLVDRFGRGHGAPDARAADLPGLLPALAARLDLLTRSPAARPADAVRQTRPHDP